MSFLQRIVTDVMLNLFDNSNNDERYINTKLAKQLILGELLNFNENHSVDSIQEKFNKLWDKYHVHLDFKTALSIIKKYLEILIQNQLSSSLITKSIDSLLNAYKEYTSFSFTTERANLYADYDIQYAIEFIHTTLETQIPIQRTYEAYIDEIERLKVKYSCDNISAIEFINAVLEYIKDDQKQELDRTFEKMRQNAENLKDISKINIDQIKIEYIIFNKYYRKLIIPETELSNTAFNLSKIKHNNLYTLIDLIINESQLLLKITKYEEAFVNLGRSENYLAKLNSISYLLYSEKISELYSNICYNESKPKYDSYIINLFLGFIFNKTFKLLNFPYFGFAENKEKSLANNWPFKSNKKLDIGLKNLNIFKYKNHILQELFEFTYIDIPALYGIDSSILTSENETNFNSKEWAKSNQATIHEWFNAIEPYRENINWEIIKAIVHFPDKLINKYYYLVNK